MTDAGAHHLVALAFHQRRGGHTALQLQKQLTLQGNIVISVGLFGHAGDPEAMEPATKKMLDDMHKRKILMADEIFVVNRGGYIGASTQSEIAFAQAQGIPVRYLVP